MGDLNGNSASDKPLLLSHSKKIKKYNKKMYNFESKINTHYTLFGILPADVRKTPMHGCIHVPESRGLAANSR